MAKKEIGRSSLGMEANLAALLSYLFGFITGIIFYVVEKDSKYVKFHAMQSILISVFIIVLSFVLAISVIGLVLVPFVNLGGFILWIILMIKAYQGEQFKLPVIGDVADKNAAK